MTEAADRSQVLTVDGVTVEKRLNKEHSQHVAVIFELRSERDDPVRIRLYDAVPSAYPVGFHPDFSGQKWSMTGDGVEFEAVLEPGEKYKTVYGVGDVSASKVHRLANDPSVEVSAEFDEAPDSVDPVETEPRERAGDLDELDDLDLSTEDAGGVRSSAGEDPASREDASESGPDLADPESDIEPPDFDAGTARPDEPSPGALESEGMATVRITDSRLIVEKRLDRTKFSFPAVVYAIMATSEAPIDVRIEDRLPASLSDDDFSFHHRYGDEFWEQQGRRLVFEREFDPGEEYTTLYAIQDLDDTTEAELMETPAVTVWNGSDPADGDGERIHDATPPEDRQTASSQDRGRDQGDHDQASHASGTRQEPETGANAEDSLKPASGEADARASNAEKDEFEPGDEDDTLIEDLFELDDSDPAWAFSDSVDPDRELTALADQGSNREHTEAEDGSEAATQRSQNRTHGLGATPPPGEKSRAADVWISGRMQERFEELVAAVRQLPGSSPLEDKRPLENGEALEELNRQFDQIRTTVNAIDDRSSAIASTLEGLAETLSSVEQTIRDRQDTLDEELSELSTMQKETIYQIQERIEDLTDQVAPAESPVSESVEQSDSTGDELSRIRSQLESNSEALRGLESTQETLLDAIESIQDRLTEIEEFDHHRGE